MITIQLPEEKQAGSVSRFIEENRLALSVPVRPEESMILLEDDRVLGYGAYCRDEDEAVVTMLYIHPSSRGVGFGDGLLRGLLNLMDRNGIRHFYVPGNAAMLEFLKAEGLTPMQEPPSWYQAAASGLSWFDGSLPEFFQRPCKGGHKRP